MPSSQSNLNRCWTGFLLVIGLLGLWLPGVAIALGRSETIAQAEEQISLTDAVLQLNAPRGQSGFTPGQLEDLEAGATAFLEQVPPHLLPVALTMRGLALFHQGDLDASLIDLDQALRLAPTFPPALAARARLQAELSNPEAVAADLATLARTEPILAQQVQAELTTAGLLPDRPAPLRPASDPRTDSATTAPTSTNRHGIRDGERMPR